MGVIIDDTQRGTPSEQSTVTMTAGDMIPSLAIQKNKGEDQYFYFP